MQLVKMATHQSGVAEAQVQVVMEVAEEVEQGGALTMVVHGALRVVVAVSAADHHPNAIAAVLLITGPTMAVSCKAFWSCTFPAFC
jgi:metal-dependent amidase/aminoacylase/carboxypeptidase family protein